MGVDSTGLSVKVREAQAEALRSIVPLGLHSLDGQGFVEDLGALQHAQHGLGRSPRGHPPFARGGP